MFDDLLRPPKDRLLTPFADRLGSVHPHLISVLALAAGLAAAALAADRRYGAALGCWLLNRTLDGLDGAVARAHGRQSDLGGYIDILADFIVYAAIPIALAVADPRPEVRLWALLLVGAFYLNAASWLYPAALLERKAQGAAVRHEQTSITMPSGLIAGTETIVFYALFLLFPARIELLFGVMAALVLVTVGQRFTWAVRTL